MAGWLVIADKGDDTKWVLLDGILAGVQGRLTGCPEPLELHLVDEPDHLAVGSHVPRGILLGWPRTLDAPVALAASATDAGNRAGRGVQAALGVLVEPNLEAFPIVLAHHQSVLENALRRLLHQARLLPRRPGADNVVALQRRLNFSLYRRRPPRQGSGQPGLGLWQRQLPPQDVVAVRACTAKGRKSDQLRDALGLDGLGKHEHPPLRLFDTILHHPSHVEHLVQVQHWPVCPHLEQRTAPCEAHEAAHGAEVAVR
mmetsp:Transcript_30893/g.88873  ORF Transcript_30893/g.88873 Transcript_30893/m.88873 type:complete len:257 (-) Transcript_30893:2094-2864(-)